LGIERVVLAVNKMDLVGYDKATYDAIVADYTDFAGKVGLTDITAIPMSALTGAM
jgi:sulfate adenylyltransferase subunit 1 (EFTu-like GTPase family)